ncbi:MAG TPA: enoyl-CoA hydratase/isomerase family protein [Amycolatopsis sp.]|jgi:enoyl-CoA hydratase|nr:enoyl-CoA hydratase/isomerase family protein [Amycolatopsis sp.]
MLHLEYRTTAILVRIPAAPRRVLTAELLDNLTAAIAYIGPAQPIVLTGTGSVFLPDLDPVDGPARAAASVRLPRVLSALRTHPLPVIAAINGDAVGAGYILAEAADIRVMSAGAIQPSSPTAGRYHVPEALDAGLIEHRCEPENLIEFALKQADGLRYARS